MPTKNKYPAAFYLARLAVLDRAKNCCESCGVENYKPHPLSGKLVRLQVHHINNNTEDNDLENLRVLCASCHTKRKEKTNKTSDTGKKTDSRHKDGTFSKKKKTRSNAKKRHGEEDCKQGRIHTSGIHDLRVFLRKNKVVLKKLRLYGELDRLAVFFSMSEGEKVATEKVESPTKQVFFSMPQEEISGEMLTPERRFHRTKEEQDRIDAGYREMEGAVTWFKSLSGEKQKEIRAKIIKAHGSFAERLFVLERYGRGLQSYLLKEQREYESKEKAK